MDQHLYTLFTTLPHYFFGSFLIDHSLQVGRSSDGKYTVSEITRMRELLGLATSYMPPIFGARVFLRRVPGTLPLAQIHLV